MSGPIYFRPRLFALNGFSNSYLTLLDFSTCEQDNRIEIEYKAMKLACAVKRPKRPKRTNSLYQYINRG